MENPLYKIAAIEMEDCRCKGLQNGMDIGMEDLRCEGLSNRATVQTEDPRCKSVAIVMEDPRCQLLQMNW